MEPGTFDAHFLSLSGQFVGKPLAKSRVRLKEISFRPLRKKASVWLASVRRGFAQLECVRRPHPRPRSVVVTDPPCVARAVTERTTAGLKRTRPALEVAVTLVGRELRNVTTRLPKTCVVTVHSPCARVVT